jgi:secreted trypsin-like serine protease
MTEGVKPIKPTMASVGQRILTWCSVLTLLLFLSVADAILTAPEDNNVANIVGGGKIPIEKAPWMVVLYRKTYKDATHYVLYRGCAGVIVAPQVILTAQHCVPPSGDNVEYLVSSGTADLAEISAASQISVVKKIVRYPRFYSESYGKDIALLMLDYPLEMNSRQKSIALATGKEAKSAEATGKPGFIFGWGATYDKGPFSEQLRMGAVKMRTNSALLSTAGPLTPDQIPAANGKTAK